MLLWFASHFRFSDCHKRVLLWTYIAAKCFCLAWLLVSPCKTYHQKRQSAWSEQAVEFMSAFGKSLQGNVAWTYVCKINSQFIWMIYNDLLRWKLEFESSCSTGCIQYGFERSFWSPETFYSKMRRRVLSIQKRITVRLTCSNSEYHLSGWETC